METKGGEIFSRMHNAPNAKSLGDILHKKHGVARARKTDRGVLEPPERSTILIHPTPVSTMALDLAFTRNAAAIGSSHSGEYSRHVEDLKDAFAMYTLAHMLFLIKAKFPWLIPTLRVGTSEDVRTREMHQATCTIFNALDTVDCVARIRRLADHFQRAVCFHLALGVVPYEEQRGSPVIGSHSTHGDPLVRVVDGYLAAIEQANSVKTVLPLDYVTENVLLTWRDGIYACSDISGRAQYGLWTFKQQTTSGFGISDVRPILLDIVQYEVQATFANEHDRRRLIDRMAKTTVVVSTEFSRESEALFKSATSGLTAISDDDVTVMAGKVKQDREAFVKEQAKAALIGDLEFDLGNEMVDDSKLQHDIMKETVRANRELEKRLRDPKLNTTEAPDEGMPTYGFSGANVIRSTFSQGGAKAREQQRKREVRVEQERVLQSKLTDSERRVRELSREVTILRDEARKLGCANDTMDHLMKIKGLEIQHVERRSMTLQKEVESLKRSSSKKDELIDRMRKLVDRMANDMGVNEDDRNRMIVAFTNRANLTAAGMTSGTGWDTNEQEFQNMIKFFCMGGLKKGKVDRHEDRRRLDYERVLNEMNMKPLPVFTHVQHKSELAACNFWLQYEWMYDEPVNVLHKPPGEDCRKRIIDTPELSIIDVNPRTDEEVERACDVLTAVNPRAQVTLDSLFHRRFLSAVYPTRGNIGESINQSMDQRWHTLCVQALALSPNSFTETGQRIGERVAANSIDLFIRPFFAQYAGQHPFAYRLPDFVASVLTQMTVQRVYAMQERNTLPTRWHALVTRFLDEPCSMY